MTVTVKLFGMLKTLTGNQGELQVALGDKGTVYELAQNIQATFPEIGDMLLKKRVLVSVNHDIAHWDTELNTTDEIALLPPFAGGALSRMLKKHALSPLEGSAAGVLAALRGSTYQTAYASPLRSLRPCWTWLRRTYPRHSSLRYKAGSGFAQACGLPSIRLRTGFEHPAWLFVVVGDDLRFDKGFSVACEKVTYE